jgi:NADPH2:quinone reductase
MRAVVYSETGGPEVLRLIDRPEQTPAPGQVAVAIKRSGVNPTDVKSRQGGEPGKPVDPVQVPGQDGAGVVVAVGQGVDANLVGQRVWVWEAAYQRPEGTTQQITTVPVHQVVHLPDSASFDVGASLPIPFMTAHRCLTVGEHAPARLGPGALAGKSVLVAGGAGAVGNAAIQLARWSDALAITTVSSPQKAQLAAAAGADHIINYRQEDVAAEIAKIAPAGVDSIVEVAIASNAAVDSEVLKNGGSIASYATDGGSEVTLGIRPLMTKNVRVQFVLVYTAPPQAKRHATDDITLALVTGGIRVGDEAGLPLHHYPLEQASQAHAAVESGATGKVLIDVAD